MIESRNNAKNRRDFDEADQVRDQLKAAGVNIDDRSRTWSTGDGRSGKMEAGGGFARGDKETADGNLSWENTIYVQGLPDNVKLPDIEEFFGRLGKIKKSKKNHNMGEPVIHLYKDKRTGRPKGDATISYDEVSAAASAVEWYNGVDFMERPGAKLKVSIATRPAAARFEGGKGGKGKGKW